MHGQTYTTIILPGTTVRYTYCTVRSTLRIITLSYITVTCNIYYATMTLLRWYTSNTAAAPAQSCYDIQNDTETLQLLEHNIPLRVGPRRSPGFVVVPVLLVGSRVIVARPFSLFSTALHISLVKWIHATATGRKEARF